MNVTYFSSTHLPTCWSSARTLSSTTLYYSIYTLA
jgi:hypothetical protein